MAFAQVQTSAQATGAANVINITVSATGAGNLVVVHIRMASTTETCTSVTDDKGNTYVVSSPIDNTGTRLYQAYGVQVTGGVTTVTPHFSGTVQKRCGADEYSGNASSNAATFDATTTGTGSGTSIAVSTLTPAASGELIIGSYCTNANVTWTAGTGYTLYNGSGSVNMRSQYRLSGTTSETAPVTIGSTLWNAIATAFKPATVTIVTKNLAALGVG